MAFTYTDDPAGTPRDLVRLLVGDIDAREPLAQDSEVALALSLEGGDAYLAAAWVAERLAARFARDLPVTGDGITVPGGEARSKAFSALAARLRAEAADRGTVASGGSVAGTAVRSSAVVLTGVSVSEMAAVEALADRPPSAIRRDDPSLWPPREEAAL